MLKVNLDNSTVTFEYDDLIVTFKVFDLPAYRDTDFFTDEHLSKIDGLMKGYIKTEGIEFKSYSFSSVFRKAVGEIREKERYVFKNKSAIECARRALKESFCINRASIMSAFEIGYRSCKNAINEEFNESELYDDDLCLLTTTPERKNRLIDIACNMLLEDIDVCDCISIRDIAKTFKTAAEICKEEIKKNHLEKEEFIKFILAVNDFDGNYLTLHDVAEFFGMPESKIRAIAHKMKE